MADEQHVEETVEQGADAKGKKRVFRKYSYRGVDLDKLLELNNEKLVELFSARQRRRFSHGLKRKEISLINKSVAILLGVMHGLVS